MNKQNQILLTFDTDWCPDSMIEYVLQKLERYDIKSTWFVTHDSPVIQMMKSHNLVELGIHPNFDEDSTQGKDLDDIIQNLLKIIPNAVSMRTHALLWSSRFFEKLSRYGIKYDSSLLLHNSRNIEPTKYDHANLIRFPIYWEDDIALLEKDINIDLNVKGMKILNLHPIHILLNSYDMKNYNLSKINGGSWSNYINHTGKKGIGDVFEKLISKIKGSNTMTMQELGVFYN